jgi:hypothetical protein
MSLSLEKVEALEPGQSSLDATRKPLKAAAQDIALVRGG